MEYQVGSDPQGRGNGSASQVSASFAAVSSTLAGSTEASSRMGSPTSDNRETRLDASTSSPSRGGEVEAWETGARQPGKTGTEASGADDLAAATELRPSHTTAVHDASPFPPLPGGVPDGQKRDDDERREGHRDSTQARRGDGSGSRGNRHFGEPGIGAVRPGYRGSPTPVGMADDGRCPDQAPKPLADRVINYLAQRVQELPGRMRGPRMTPDNRRMVNARTKGASASWEDWEAVIDAQYENVRNRPETWRYLSLATITRPKNFARLLDAPRGEPKAAVSERYSAEGSF